MRRPVERNQGSGLFWLFGLGALIVMIAVAIAAGATLDTSCVKDGQPVACEVNR